MSLEQEPAPVDIHSPVTARTLVDPGRTLPGVTLEVQKTTHLGNLQREAVDLMFEGIEVGWGHLETDDQSVHFSGVKVDDKLKGKGYGLASYLAAIEYAHAKGLRFETDNQSLSPEAVKIWRHLADIGVAQVVEPFRPSRFPGNFKGRYVVPVS